MGKKSLRDLFQWMNDHYAKQHRYFPDSAGVEEAAETITGQSFADFFRDYVAGVKEIPVRRLLPVSPACIWCHERNTLRLRVYNHGESWRPAGGRRRSNRTATRTAWELQSAIA